MRYRNITCQEPETTVHFFWAVGFWFQINSECKKTLNESIHNWLWTTSKNALLNTSLLRRYICVEICTIYTLNSLRR